MIKRLYHYLGDQKRMVAVSILLTVFEVLCELTIPLFMSRIVDVGIPAGDLGYMARVGGGMVGVAVLAIALGVLNARISSRTTQTFSANLRGDLFHQLQGFSFSNIDRFSSASLVTRMTTDVTILQNTFMMTLRMLARAPIMLVSALIIAMSINLRLSMIIIVAIALLAVTTLFIVRMVGELFSTVQKRLDALNGTVQENLIAIRVVKAFVREGYERLKFKKANDALYDASIRAGNITSFIMPIMMLVLNGTTIGVVWFGGRFVGSGGMTTGELMSFISYIMQILMSVMMFSMIFVMITRARASAERTLEVVSSESDIRDSDDAAELGLRVTEGRVEFRHVSFHYGGNGVENVLRDVSFTAEPGEFVGIIGGTGSGKSSLVNLIPRFYDVTDGALLVDGRDVRDYTQQALRDGVGMVMQKSNLFSGTIRDNLKWGNEDATDEDIARAAADAQAHDFIASFPNGYDTELGQGGVNVSGGQKQRLCIARAMLKQPPILILDDSTSAVDTATEAHIRRSFRENFRDSTVIIVAQRITSVQDADKILVLDDGAIADLGTHDELLERCDIYREIYQSQQEGSVA